MRGSKCTSKHVEIGVLYFLSFNADPYNKPKPPYLVAIFPLTYNSIIAIRALSGLQKSEFLISANKVLTSGNVFPNCNLVYSLSRMSS